MKLNIGCGDTFGLYPQYTNLDKYPFGQEIVEDLVTYLKRAKEEGVTFEEVMANHVLEHFHNDDVKAIFNLVHDVLVPGGKFRIVVPHKDNKRAYILDHYSYYTEETFRWLQEKDMDVYEMRPWVVEELVTNGRLHIHALLRKV